MPESQKGWGFILKGQKVWVLKLTGVREMVKVYFPWGSEKN